MKSLRLLLTALLLAALMPPAAAQALVKPGKAMPPMSLPDVAGQNHDLKAAIKDKVALVVYWSVSCPHCQKEMPQLLALAKRLEGNPFTLLLINTDGQAMAPVVQAYAAEHKLPAPHIMDVGPQDSVPFADAFDIIATPGVLVFDRGGRLTFISELSVDHQALQQAIDKAF
jgi:thiol-disulfide isomerase/thioredoxin